MPAQEALVMEDVDTQDQNSRVANTTDQNFDLQIYMSFQPVIDAAANQVLSHEALVRGPSGRSEATVMARVTPENQQDFDRKCRITAIETASALGMKEDLSINFMPSAVNNAEELIEHVQWTAEEFDFPLNRIHLEYSELDRPSNMAHLKEICRLTRRAGLRTVIDDFGAGHSSLLRLSALRPTVVKLDQAFVRKIDGDPRRRSIISGIQAICLDLDITLVGKGVETQEEFDALVNCGVDVFQGNFLAEPMLEYLQDPGDINFPRKST